MGKLRLKGIRELVQSHAGIKGRNQNWNPSLLEAKVPAVNGSARCLLFTVGPPYMWVLHLSSQPNSDGKRPPKRYIVVDIYYVLGLKWFCLY